jgi:tetratricopeptide (TPR) repeat protein
MVSATQAQHSIDVEKKTQSGEWLEALTAYKKMPTRKVTATTALSAAKSAWALGLVDLAKKEFDRALVLDSSSAQLSTESRARIYFSRGAIELQEGNYQGAIVYAEKADKLVREAGPLNSEINQLWGEALFKSNKPQLALRKLEQALTGVSNEHAGDLHYSIGSAAMILGQLEKAEDHFTQIPVRHVRSALAIKSLGTIALENRKYQEVIFWLNKGREEYPDAFLDSWVDYALTKSYSSIGESQKATETATKAAAMYPPSDGWLILLQSISEQAKWRTDASAMAQLGKNSSLNEGSNGH